MRLNLFWGVSLFVGIFPCVADAALYRIEINGNITEIDSVDTGVDQFCLSTDFPDRSEVVVDRIRVWPNAPSSQVRVIKVGDMAGPGKCSQAIAHDKEEGIYSVRVFATPQSIADKYQNASSHINRLRAIADRYINTIPLTDDMKLAIRSEVANDSKYGFSSLPLLEPTTVDAATVTALTETLGKLRSNEIDCTKQPPDVEIECEFKSTLSVSIESVLGAFESPNKKPGFAVAWQKLKTLRQTQSKNVAELSLYRSTKRPGSKFDFLANCPNIMVSFLQTEVNATDDEFFFSAKFGDDKTFKSPAYENGYSYVRITKYPQDLDAKTVWRATKTDAGRSLQVISQVAGFLVESATGLKQPSFATPSPGTSVGVDSGGVKLEPVVFPDALLPLSCPIKPDIPTNWAPVIATGTKYIGPIRTADKTKYELSIVENEQTVTPSTPHGAFAHQTIVYNPRSDWLYTLSANLEADGIESDAVKKYTWANAGPTSGASTAYRLTHESQNWRHTSVSLSFVFGPSGCFYQRLGRFVLMANVGVPFQSPKGISQLTAGIGFRLPNGVIFSAFGGTRMYDKATIDKEDAVIILANSGATSPKAPEIGSTTAYSGVVGVAIGIDLAVVGNTLVDGISPLFQKATP